MSERIGTWMAELAPDEEYKGASNCVLRCEHGHRWGAWSEATGTRCIARVENSKYKNGLCGSILSQEERDGPPLSVKDAEPWP